MKVPFPLRLLRIWLFGLMLLPACQPDEPAAVSPPEEPLTAAQAYFLEVALGAEFGGPELTRKWVTDVRVFLPDTSHTLLLPEFDRVVTELNPLLHGVTIRRVFTRSQANLILYLGDGNTFAREYEPNARPFLNNNLGLFFAYWNSSLQINRANVFVDVVRTVGLDCQKHLLREELTQALGLMKDSERYPDSIFQQAYTCTTSYAAIDREVIALLYDPAMQTGWNRNQVLALFRKK